MIGDEKGLLPVFSFLMEITHSMYVREFSKFQHSCNVLIVHGVHISCKSMAYPCSCCCMVRLRTSNNLQPDLPPKKLFVGLRSFHYLFFSFN